MILLHIDEESVVVVLELAELDEVFGGGGALVDEQVDGEVPVRGLN